MPIPQKTIVVELADGRRSKAIASGNNAAWICTCGRAVALLGKASAVAGASEGRRVDCPDCGRGYFVVPDGKDQGTVLKVVEAK